MKTRLNMELFYRQERDKNFFQVCEKIRKNSKAYVSVAEIAKKAVLEEADEYYITLKQMIVILTCMRCEKNIDTLSEHKRALYKDIFSRYWVLKKKNPTMRTFEIAKMIHNEKAPRFYFSDSRAKSLYYKLIKTNGNAIPIRHSVHSDVPVG